MIKDFEKIDWKKYNRPPFYQQWLCFDDALKLASFGDKGLAELDERILSLKDRWDLDNAHGRELDRIGKLLDEKRNGSDDDYYRLLLKLRIILNTNDGTIPSMIHAIKYLHQAKIVEIVPRYPAGISITHDGEDLLRDIVRIIDAIIPAGIGCDVIKIIEASFNQYIGIGAVLMDTMTLRTTVTGRGYADVFAGVYPDMGMRTDILAKENDAINHIGIMPKLEMRVDILSAD